MENPNRADAATRDLSPNSAAERTGRQARARVVSMVRRLWGAVPVIPPRHTPPGGYRSPRGVPLLGKPNRQCARATPRVAPVAGRTIAAPRRVGFGSPRSRHDLPSGRDRLGFLRSGDTHGNRFWDIPEEELGLNNLCQ